MTMPFERTRNILRSAAGMIDSLAFLGQGSVPLWRLLRSGIAGCRRDDQRLARVGRQPLGVVILGPAYLRPLTNSASIGNESPAAPCHSSSAAWTSATNPARAAGPAAPIGPASGDPAP
jgi:hypothetical protein